MNVGKPLGLHLSHTSSIRRIEGAMLSFQADMTIENNPSELGLGRLVDLDMESGLCEQIRVETCIHAEGASAGPL